MGNPGRKLARQNKRNSPEGKEQIKQEKAEKAVPLPPQSHMQPNQSAVGHKPQMQIRQRRAGNS